MNVKVHNRQGKVICKIEEPFTWQDVLLSFTPISRKWKNPAKIEEWAWDTAKNIADLRQMRSQLSPESLVDTLNEMVRNGKSVPIGGYWLFGEENLGGYLCSACLNQSIFSMSRRRDNEFIGYACTFKNCPMRNVIIPKVLVETIKEEEKKPATPTPKD